jgi:hypothetical protein
LPGVQIGEATDQIDHIISVGNRASHAGGLAHIGGNQLDLAQITQRFDGIRGRYITLRHAQPRARCQQGLRDITPQKAAAAKNCYQLALHKCSVTQRE